MSDPQDEIRVDELSPDEFQELLGELGQQLTPDQLGLLMELVSTCEDLDEALAALDEVDKAA